MRTDRAENVELHRRVAQAVLQSVRGAHLACGSVQQSLIDTPAASPPAPRTTSKGIAPGDIVQVDKKGRRFHALVTELDQQESGRFELMPAPARLADLLPHRDGAGSDRRVAQGAPRVTAQPTV